MKSAEIWGPGDDSDEHVWPEHGERVVLQDGQVGWYFECYHCDDTFFCPRDDSPPPLHDFTHGRGDA